jgi:hypothetical protein
MEITVLIICKSDEGDSVRHLLNLNSDNISNLKDFKSDFDFDIVNGLVQDKDDFIQMVLKAAPKLPIGWDNKCAIIGMNDQTVDPDTVYFWDYATSLN